MIIYFSGIVEERNFLANNKKYNDLIVRRIGAIGHDIIKDDFNTDSLFFDWKGFGRKLNVCDTFVSEVTGSSTRLGFQLYCAEQRKMPTYAFYSKLHEGEISLMILQNPYFRKVPYTDERDIQNLVRTIFPPFKRKYEQKKLVL